MSDTPGATDAPTTPAADAVPSTAPAVPGATQPAVPPAPAANNSVAPLGQPDPASGDAAAPAADEAPALDPGMVVPETADGYVLPVPEGDDGAFAKTAAAWFHEAGIPPAQAEKLANKWNEFAAAQQAETAANTAALEAQAQARFDKETGDLRKEWGAEYDKNVDLGRRAYQQFGFTEEVVNAVEDAVGPAQLLRLFSNIGAKLGEDGATGLNAKTGPLTFDSAAKSLYG